MNIPEQVDYLVNQLNAQQYDLKLSSSYYDGTFRVRSIGLSTPPELRVLATAVGWSRLYVDTLTSRLCLKSFRATDPLDKKKQKRAEEPPAEFDPLAPPAPPESPPPSPTQDAVDKINQWWVANNLDERHILGIKEALIHGRAYITISKPDPTDPLADPDVPVIKVESPYHLYAEIDPRTDRVTRAIRLYKEQREVLHEWATLYLPDLTAYLRFENSRWVVESVDRHNLGVVPVVPLIGDDRLTSPYGTSVITPELRTLTDAGQRTLMNLQAAMEVMALPQKLIFGVEQSELVELDDDGNPKPGQLMDAYMGRILTFENEMGKAFQFQAADLRNFCEVLDQLAKHVASYTGLPPQYLSFSSDNPASAEAIGATEARLVRTCELLGKTLGGKFEQAMLVACQVMGVEITPELRRLESAWQNPATPTYASVMDAAVKGYGNGNGIIPKERARMDIGYSDEERQEMRLWDQEEASVYAENVMRMMATSDVPPGGDDTEPPPK